MSDYILRFDVINKSFGYIESISFTEEYTKDQIRNIYKDIIKPFRLNQGNIEIRNPCIKKVNYVIDYKFAPKYEKNLFLF